jgi:hypothetical protein
MKNTNKKSLKEKTLVCINDSSYIQLKKKEIEKYRCNIRNGIIGMNRDINNKLTKFFKEDNDIVEVFNFILFLFNNIMFGFSTFFSN